MEHTINKERQLSKWAEILFYYDELAGMEPEDDIIRCVCIDGYS